MENGDANLGQLLRHVSTFDVNHSVANVTCRTQHNVS
jgi:hypothetical protein